MRHVVEVPAPQPLPGGPGESERGVPRLRGVDVARALAVVGMVMVHIGPFAAERLGAAGRVYDVSHGRASILFVVLAGVGVSLLAGDRGPERRRRVRRRLAWRAAVLLPVGLALQPLDHGVLVILQYYALYFVVAVLAVPLGDRTLAGAAVLVAVAGPVVRLALERVVPAWFEGAPATLGTPPLLLARDLVLTGSYPAITWSAPLLAGLWLGRLDLRAPEVRRRLVLDGAGLALAAGAVSWTAPLAVGQPQPPPSWTWLATAAAHSETSLWLLTATGIAVAVLGVCLVAADRWPRVTWPLAAVGELALTFYVAHLLVLVEWPWLLERDTVAAAAGSVLRFTAVVALGATLYRAVLPRGPLEALLRAPAQASERLTSRGRRSPLASPASGVHNSGEGRGGGHDHQDLDRGDRDRRDP